MPEISLRQVEAFKAVVEHGTVSFAASALRISQPSLSKLVASLERQTGLSLFERQKGRLVLTDRGRRFYSEVDRIFVGLDQLARAVSEIRREESEVLRIGIVPALSGNLLLKAVQSYKKLRPGVRLSILVRDSHLLVDRIENGKLDILFASRATEIKGLERASLMPAPVICILPPGHHLTAQTIITPASLEGENIISLTQESTLPRRMTEAFNAANCTLSSTIEISSITGVCNFVEGGVGVSLVHPLVAASSGIKLTIRPFEPAIIVDFYIYRTAAQRTRPYVEDFIRIFQETAVDIVGRDSRGHI